MTSSLDSQSGPHATNEVAHILPSDPLGFACDDARVRPEPADRRRRVAVRELDALHAAISGSGTLTTTLWGRVQGSDRQRATDLLEEVSGTSDEFNTRVQLVPVSADDTCITYTTHPKVPNLAPGGATSIDPTLITG
jgi:hypothetical protein